MAGNLPIDHDQEGGFGEDINNPEENEGEQGAPGFAEDAEEKPEEDQNKPSPLDRARDIHQKYKNAKEQYKQFKNAETAGENVAKGAGETGGEASIVGGEAAGVASKAGGLAAGADEAAGVAAGAGEAAAAGGEIAAAGAAGVTTAGIGAVVVAAIVLAKNVWDSLKNFRKGHSTFYKIMLVIGIFLVPAILLVALFGLSLSTSKNHNGPDQGGSTVNRPLTNASYTDTILADLGAGAKGPFTQASIANMNSKIDTMINQLPKMGLTSSQQSQIVSLFNQIKSLEPQLLSASSASDPKAVGNVTAKIANLMTQINAIEYPGGAAAMLSVINLINSGEITFTNRAAKNDLVSGHGKSLGSPPSAVNPLLYNIITVMADKAQASGYKLTIGTVISNHNTEASDGSGKSLHTMGQAVDIETTTSSEQALAKILVPYLFNHYKTYKVTGLIYNCNFDGTGLGAYNIAVPQTPRKGNWASDHSCSSHFHVSVLAK